MQSRDRIPISSVLQMVIFVCVYFFMVLDVYSCECLHLHGFRCLFLCMSTSSWFYMSILVCAYVFMALDVYSCECLHIHGFIDVYINETVTVVKI